MNDRLLYVLIMAACVLVPAGAALYGYLAAVAAGWL
jgi:hypothetical protein